MLKILVVNEDLDSRLSITGVLRHMACEVDTQAQPQLALSMISNFNPYDVIFVALTMREITGIRFALLIRKKYPDARIILTSPLMPPPEIMRELKAQGLFHWIFSEPRFEHYRAVITSILETNAEMPTSH